MANIWTITGAAAGNINSAVNFTGMENLTGGSAADTFNIAADFGGIINGGSGNDSFNINSNMGGTLNGDAGNDAFYLSNNVIVASIDGGADHDTLDFSGYTSARNIALTGNGANGFSGTEASISSGFSNIDAIVGGSAADSLTGMDTAATWSVNTTGQYAVASGTLAYSSIETLQGGAGIDTYNISGDYTGTVNGGGEGDIFNINASMSGSLNGEAGTDTFYLGDDVTVGAIDGGSDLDSLVAPDVTNIWNITGVGAGTIITSAGVSPDVEQSFTGMDVLNGGAAADTFIVSAEYGGDIHGGGSADAFTINYAVNGSLYGDAGADTFNLNANVDGSINGGDDGDTFNLNANAQSITINGDSGFDEANIDGDISVTGNTNLNLGEGNIKAGGSLQSGSGSFGFIASNVTLNSVATSGNISVEARNGNINLGRLLASDVSLLVLTGNIANTSNGYIQARTLFVDLGSSGVMGSLYAPFELQIEDSSEFSNIPPSQLQSRVFITDNSFLGLASSGNIVGVNSVLAQANAGLSAVTKELNIIDPGIFLTEINLFNIEESGIKLPADQIAQ